MSYTKRSLLLMGIVATQLMFAAAPRGRMVMGNPRSQAGAAPAASGSRVAANPQWTLVGNRGFGELTIASPDGQQHEVNVVSSKVPHNISAYDRAGALVFYPSDSQHPAAGQRDKDQFVFLYKGDDGNFGDVNIKSDGTINMSQAAVRALKPILNIDSRYQNTVAGSMLVFPSFDLGNKHYVYVANAKTYRELVFDRNAIAVPLRSLILSLKYAAAKNRSDGILVKDRAGMLQPLSPDFVQGFTANPGNIATLIVLANIFRDYATLHDSEILEYIVQNYQN